MTATQAYADIDAMNWSTLKLMATSAKLLKHRVDNPRPDTLSLKRGRAAHCAVLEPERWAREYLAEPESDLRTNAGKAARAEWLAAIAGPRFVAQPCFNRSTKAGKEEARAWENSVPEGRTVIVGNEKAEDILGPEACILPRAEYELAERCAQAVQEHDVARHWISGGRYEEVATWTDPATGIDCKARFDFIQPLYVLDVKTSRQQNLRTITRDVALYHYYGQLAWYHDGAIAAGLIPRVDAERPRILVVQTVEPFDVVPLFLKPEDLQTGRALYRDLLEKYSRCVKLDWWPGLAPSPVEIELPPWADGAEEQPENDNGDDW